MRVPTRMVMSRYVVVRVRIRLEERIAMVSAGG